VPVILPGANGITMAGPMKTVSFKLPEQLDNVLTELAKRRKASRSALVREALEALAKGRRRSVTSCVDELSLDVDGPADLATNPKYMAGYGK
jgi:hypothetical protein